MPTIRKDNLTPAQKSETERLFSNGVNVSRIAETVGKSRTAIVKYLRDLGLYRSTKQQLRLESLTAAQRRDLARMSELNVSYRVVAERMGFTDWQQARNTMKRLGLLAPRHSILHHEGRRRCHECRTIQPTANFRRNSYLCLDCAWFYMAEYKYGITRADLEALLRKQKSVCAICRRACRERRNLCVDHDHVSKRVRGLLCNRCNRGIGLFADLESRLSEAALYVRRRGIAPDHTLVAYGEAGNDRRNHRRKSHYGLHPHVFDALLGEQAHRCAICRGRPRSKRKQLAVDHDRRTGRIRGLLCENCNRAIGLFDHKSRTLQRAARYVSVAP